jgi:hypothetical protein
VPLYLAGARMLTNYPTSIVVHGLALNITVQSYDQSLDFGLMADAQALPDVRALADALRMAWDDLLALPHAAAEAEVPGVAALVGRAQRAVTGAVAGAVTGAVSEVTRRVVGGAIDGAMRQARGRMGARPAGKPPRRR